MNSRGQLSKDDKGVLTWNPSWTLQKLVITDQLISANSQTCNYTHDDLRPTASANCTANIRYQTFGYDPFGNISKTAPSSGPAISFLPTYDYTNNTHRIQSAPFAYNNNNSNMTTNNNHTYSYDTEDKIITIDSDRSGGICLIFDALGRVVNRTRGTRAIPASTS